MIATDSSLQRRLERVKSTLGIDDDDLVAALGITQGDLDAWQTSTRELPSSAMTRWDRLAALSLQLQETFMAEDVPGWMRQEQPYLQGRTPIEALRCGRLDHVEGALEIVDAGIFL